MIHTKPFENWLSRFFLFLSIYLPRNLLPKEDLAYKPTLIADKNKIFSQGGAHEALPLAEELLAAGGW